MPSARFERATYRLGGDRSILLSYEDANLSIASSQHNESTP